MENLLKIDTQQQLIQEVVFDYYGKRMASCSHDGTIKVWDSKINSEGEEEWIPSGEPLKIGGSSGMKIAWIHPEFGQAIAVSSVKSLRIFEEQENEKSEGGKKWIERARFPEAQVEITDIEFAPKTHGLKLAAVSQDGLLRMFEVADIMDLSQWNLSDEIEISASREKGNYCLSFCKSRLHPLMIAVNLVKDPAVKIYRLEGRTWMVVETLQHQDQIHDIAWAPNLGRTYHLIATASKDQKVRIWKVKDDEGDKFKSELVGTFSEHSAEVWKASWNITGTILSTSGDDGVVRLWKANYLEEWQMVSEIKSSDTKNI